MEISFGLVVQFHSRFTIRSTITETMYFLAKSRFASVYEDLANRIRIPSVYDVKKNSPALLPMTIIESSSYLDT